MTIDVCLETCVMDFEGGLDPINFEIEESLLVPPWLFKCITLIWKGVIYSSSWLSNRLRVE